MPTRNFADAHPAPHNFWYRTIDGVDFITLDDATADQFDAAQLTWLTQVLRNDRHDDAIRALVVGMHEALPESLRP
jgi:hypothetical protein